MVFAVTAAVVGGIIGKSNQKRAYDRNKRDADLQRLIDGSAPSILAAEGVDAESFQLAGTEVADIDKAIEQSYYGGEPPSEEILAVPEEVPAEELAMLLQSNPELFQDQGIMGMASGGAVGTPEDVYYFGVPQIMGMMQDPNPQIQGVGMQLADQMATMPDAGMVPATANQIQSMAYGGAVTAKKFDKGGSTGYDQDLDAAYLYRSGLMEQLNKLNTLVEEGIIGETTADQDRQQIMSELLRSLNPDEINLETLFDADKMLSKEASPRRNRLDENLLKELSTESEDVLLDGLRNFDSTNVEQYKGILDSFDFPQEQESSSKRQPSDKDLQNFHERYGLEMSNGGPITSERLNQLRRR